MLLNRFLRLSVVVTGAAVASAACRGQIAEGSGQNAVPTVDAGAGADAIATPDAPPQPPPPPADAGFAPVAAPLWDDLFPTQHGSASAIGASPDGTFSIAGTYSEMVTIGGSSFTAPFAGPDEGFVAKLDANGRVLWAVASAAAVPRIAVDARGSTVLARSDGCVAKLGSSGMQLWSVCFASSNLVVGDVAVQPDGTVIAVGSFEGTVNLGDGVARSSAGESDDFLAKLDGATGRTVFGTTWGGTNHDEANVITVDPAGAVVVAGIDNAEGPGTLAVRKLDASNAVVFDRNYAVSLPFPYALSTDAGGNILLAGAFNGTAHLGGATFETMGGQDAFVLKLDPGGQEVFSKVFGDDLALSSYDGYAQRASGIAADSAGNVWVTGGGEGWFAAGGQVFANDGPAFVGYVSKFSPSGETLWSVALPGDRESRGLALAASGRVVLAGMANMGTAFFATEIAEPTHP